VRVSQIATILLTLVSAVITFYMTSIGDAWKLLLSIGAGTGGVLLLRWYWWRISAWSEIAAMSAAFVVSVVLQLSGAHFGRNESEDQAWVMIYTTAATTVVWLVATFLTRPEPQETLIQFYRRTRPSLAGWRPIAALAPEVRPGQDGFWNFLDWICGMVLIYGILFGVGKLLLGEPAIGAAMLTAGVAAGVFIYWDLSRRGWRTVVD